MNENKIQILFKDSEDWLSFTGTVTLWTDFGSRTAPGRVYSKWQQPTRLVDNWNGKQEPILDTRYNAYYVEFNVRESELELLSRMQSCTTISIIDITAGLTFSPDLSDLTLFEVSDPVQVTDTTNYTVTIIFRTDKTYITYGIRPGTEYSVIAYNANADGTFKAIDTEFTTALDSAESLIFPLRFKPLYTEVDPELSVINNNDGINTPSKILSKRAVTILQFDTEINSNYFKKYCALCNNVGLNHNTDLRTGAGTLTNENWTVASGTITWLDEFTFSFSTPQNQLLVGYSLRINGIYVEEIGTLIMTGMDVTGVSIVGNVNVDFGTTTFEWIENDLLAGTVILSANNYIIPGMVLKVGSETVVINEVFDTYFTTLPELAATYTNAVFELSYFERFLETPQVTSNLFAENLYKNILAANINVLNWYPNN